MKYTCPISKKTVDDNIARLLALVAFVLIFIGYFWYPVVFLILGFDLLLRTISPKYSPFAFVARVLLHEVLHIKPKPVGLAQKRFASFVGLLFCIAIIGAIYIHATLLIQGLVIVFLIATGLAAFIDFCLGCWVFTLLQSLRR